MEWHTIVSYLLLIGLILYLTFKHQIHCILLARKKFKCKRCGHCCRLLVGLNKNDLETFSKHGLYDSVEKKKRGHFIKRINYYCPFLTLNKGICGCSNYETRPKICRTFPHLKICGIKCFDYRCRSFDKIKKRN